jgi:hypothetical protein
MIQDFAVWCLCSELILVRDLTGVDQYDDIPNGHAVNSPVLPVVVVQLATQE